MKVKHFNHPLNKKQFHEVEVFGFGFIAGFIICVILFSMFPFLRVL